MLNYTACLSIFFIQILLVYLLCCGKKSHFIKIYLVYTSHALSSNAETFILNIVFCLNLSFYFVSFHRSQLQLLGAVCLLVSLKVRAHKIISAQKLIEFSDYALTLEDLLVRFYKFCVVEKKHLVFNILSFLDLKVFGHLALKGVS